MSGCARLLSLLALFLACACSGSSGGGDGAGGDGCTPETDAALCAEASAECGERSARDRFGHDRTLACGTCAEPLWCGGGGEPNRCGATCLSGCPEGWTCAQGVCTGGDRGAIALDVRTVPVGGRILLEGVAPVAAPDCYDYTAAVSFRERVTGASATALVPCDDPDFGFALDLAPGTWRATVSPYRSEDSNLPDGWFVPASEFVVEGPRDDVVLDLRAVPVSGRLTLNGETPEAALDCYDHTVVLSFVDRAAGNSATHLVPCDAREFDFALRLPEGTYEVSAYKYRPEDSNLPDGTFVVDRALRVAGPTSGVVLDLRSVAVSGRLTANGVPPQAAPGCYDFTATVAFSELDGGSSVTARIPCDAADFSFELQVAPGTYRVVAWKYRVEDSDLPDGTFVLAPSLRIDGPTAGLALDLVHVPVSGRLTWNGARPVASPDCYDYTTAVHFRDRTTGASGSALVPCDDPDFGFELAVAPGTYAVSVSPYRSEDSNLPDGTFEVASALEIAGPTTGAVLDLRTIRASGTVTVDGRAPSIAADCYDHTAQVSLRSTALANATAFGVVGSAATTLVPCDAADFRWELEVPPGDYQAIVSPYRSEASSLPDGTWVPVHRLSIR